MQTIKWHNSYILLDIDGVMNTDPSWRKAELMPDGFLAFNNEAVGVLNSILYHEPGSVLVLVTSHRFKFTEKEWINILSNRNIRVAEVIVLPSNPQMTYTETVVHWLQMQRLHHPFGMRFVILEDDKRLNELPSWAKSKLVLLDPLVGLRRQHLERSINVLRSKGI